MNVHSLAICGATFSAEEFKLWSLTPPITLPLVREIRSCCYKYLTPCSSSQTIYSISVNKSLPASNMHFPNSGTHTVSHHNCNKLEGYRHFFSPARNRPEPTYERRSTTQPSLALRVLPTAYLLYATPAGLFIDVPRPDMEIDKGVLPQGPPQDPHQHPLRVEEVFSTHYSHSAFDMVTLVQDRVRALQFRWHVHVSKKISKLVAHPNDTLTAKTNEIGQFVPEYSAHLSLRRL